MADSPKTAAIELLPDPDASEESAAARLQTWFAQLDAEAIVEVYERDGRQQSYLFSVAVDEYSPAQLFDAVLENYGPGSYQVTHRDGGRITNTTAFRVGSSKKAKHALGPRKADVDAAPASAQPNDALLRAILAVNENVAQLAQTVASSKPEQRSTLETLQELKAMQELFTPRETPLGELMGMFRDMLEIKQTLTEGEQADPLTTAIRTLGPAISEAVGEMRKRDNSRLARIHENATQAQPQPEQPEGNDVNFLQRATLSAYLPHILEMAKTGTEPKTAAQRVAGTLANLPEQNVIAVVDWLDNENVVQELAAMDPACTEHAEWLEKTIDETLTLFYPPEADADGSTEPDANAQTAA